MKLLGCKTLTAAINLQEIHLSPFLSELDSKLKVYGKIAFAIETTFRYTFTDELDYSTNRFSELDFAGTSNDWYMFSGISLVYTFGRPACFADQR